MMTVTEGHDWQWRELIAIDLQGTLERVGAARHSRAYIPEALEGWLTKTLVRKRTDNILFAPPNPPPGALHAYCPGVTRVLGESTMRRYFFHVEDEAQQIKDIEGIELDGLDAVREEALQSARQLMSEDILGGHRPDGRRFVVTDEGGVIVAEIPFAEAII